MEEETARIGLIICIIFTLFFGVNLLNSYNSLMSQQSINNALYGGPSVCNANSYAYNSEFCEAYKAKYGDPLAVNYYSLLFPGLLFVISIMGDFYFYKKL
jgi:hypothetical protein